MKLSFAKQVKFIILLLFYIRQYKKEVKVILLHGPRGRDTHTIAIEKAHLY